MILLVDLSRIQVIGLLGSMVFLLVILEFVRRQRLKEAYSLLWLFLGAGFVVLSAAPGLLGMISSWVGIAYAPATLFLFLLIAAFMILLQYSLVLSKRAEQIKDLTQELALLAQRVEILEKDSSQPESKR